MSETSKTAEAAKKATDQMAGANQAAVQTAGKAAKETIGATVQATNNGIDRAKEVSNTVTETVAQTAEAATKAAEQSREVMLMGVRTAAGVSSHVADISYGRGHEVVRSAAHAMDIYRDASERSAERVQALLSSYLTVGRGLQHMQQAILEMVDRRIERAAHRPQDLLRCKNIVEVAEVQRDLYIDAINHAFESTSRLLEIASRTAQEAVRPLQTHTH